MCNGKYYKKIYYIYVNDSAMYTYTLPINPENSTKEHKKFWIRNPGPDGSHEDKFRKHGNK